MAKEWYCQIMGSTVGPLSPSELREMAGSGRITPGDLVRKGEGGEWATASRVKGLFDAPAVPSPAAEAKAQRSGSPATHTRSATAPESVSRSAAKQSPKLDGPTAYAMQNIMSGESIIHAAKIHPFIVLVPAFLFLCFVLGFVMVAMGSESGFAILLMLIGLPSPYFFPKSLIAFMTTECVLTNKRVIAKTGLISRKSAELLLSKIEGLQVRQGFLGRLFNYGSIAASGTGGSAAVFPGIASPFDFRKSVQEEIASGESQRQ